MPVKNRDHERVQRCVDSLQSKWTKEVLICDYRSLPALKEIKGATIFRYAKNKIWNKAHAINLMIKKASGRFIATVDCDIILHPMFIETANSYLDKNSFLYTLNVRRIKKEHIDDNFFKMRLKSKPWVKEGDRVDIKHTANGGIQMYPRKWVKGIYGLDEALIYWGGMDNDIVNRATLSGLVLINLNMPILHQEHKNLKERNLPPEEQINAFKIRVEKIKYLEHMFKEKKVRRNWGGWGNEKPNQERFLKKIQELKENKIALQKLFIEAVKQGKNSFEFKGKTFKVFNG